MKVILVSAVLMLSAFPLRAQDLPQGLPGLPGMPQDAAAEEPMPQRPDALMVLADLGPELRLSAAQEERITGLVDKKAREFDSLAKEYDKADAEEKKWSFKTNELKYRMGRLNRSIPDGIRDFLDDEQRQTFDAMMEAKRSPKPLPSISAPAQEPAAPEMSAPPPAAPKRIKRRRVIKRKRIPPAGAEAAPQDRPSAAPGQEEQPAKRRRVIRRRKAAPPAESPGSSGPAAEAPVEAEVGSYP